jgi:hypothetical protein
MRIIGLFGVLIALFAFVGCDAFLEAFFPEFAEGGDRYGKYQIGIWTEIIIPAGEPLPPGNPMIGAKAVGAWSGDPTPVAEAYMVPNLDYNDNGDAVFTTYIELFIDAEGDYRVIVWGETDNNYQPDWEEPQTDAVWWHEDEFAQDGGFWDNIFYFYEDDPEFTPRREGEAIIVSGGGNGPPNYQFNLMGQFVVDEDDTGGKQYNVELEDSTRSIDNISWDLYSFDYNSWYDGDWQYLGGATNTYFNPDFSGLTSGGRLIRGDYWFEVNINFVDGTSRFKRFPLTVVNEPTSGSGLNITVDLIDLDFDPMFLPTGNAYSVRLRLLDAGGERYRETAYATVDSFGQINIPMATVGYNATDFTEPAEINGFDMLEVAIDINDDGQINAGDFKRMWPVGLDVAYSGDLFIGIFGWEMRPVFGDEGSTY